MTGPVTEPKAQIPPIKPEYAPRNRMGTKSVMIMSLSKTIPPPPIPCMVRPTSITIELCATLEMIMPAVKQTMANVRVGKRPKMCNRAPRGRRKMVELRRKLVPVQKDSMAVP